MGQSKFNQLSAAHKHAFDAIRSLEIQPTAIEEEADQHSLPRRTDRADVQRHTDPLTSRAQPISNSAASSSAKTSARPT